ncbi:hypothetical protein [Spirillospora sp. NPDC047279]
MRGVWTFAGDAERATLVVGGDTMTATWERTDDGGATWRHWMDMTFTRES